LDNKVLNIIDARCNDEVYRMMVFNNKIVRAVFRPMAEAWRKLRFVFLTY